MDENLSDDANSELLDALGFEDYSLQQIQNYNIYDIKPPDAPLLTTQAAAAFNLQAPTLVSAYFNIHYVCETASRIIFLSVFWLRRISAFNQLETCIKIKLLRNAWPALLTIALAQVRNISLPTIIGTLSQSFRQMMEMQKMDTIRLHKVSEHIARLQTYICEMLTMSVSDVEYALLRLIILFNPCILVRRRETQMRNYVRQVQLNALNTLRKNIMELQNTNVRCSQNNHKTKRGKYGKYGELEATDTNESIDERCNTLIMNLLSLNEFDAHIMDELCFGNVMGQVHINDMIPYILTLSTTTFPSVSF